MCLQLDADAADDAGAQRMSGDVCDGFGQRQR
jgi:hypothetical protein